MTLQESLVDAHWLAARQREAAADAAPAPAVLDATALLPAPGFDGDYRLASGFEAWREAHIPGSRHADLVHAFSDHAAPRHFTHLDPQALADVLGEHGIGAETDIVLYDNGGGVWATRLWWQLRAVGVPAAVLDGGLAAWREAGFPVASGDDLGEDSDAAPAPALALTLTLRPRDDAWADIGEVAAIGSGDAPGTLVCALGPDQFDGTAPTRYTRRGHIPGSLNVPARSIVEPATGLLAADANLRAAVGPLLDAPGPIVAYCGGGISATLLALGLVRAGRDDVRIYDGSLEEWTADPARDVA
ncbi:sulfurtransferase [Actinospica durhamensis]|uniref:Sulfurtransferase n=1 Tax=Actinospica durhamensis TaxID=1508375 RepID=A0A941IPC2_9ACTN|nr:rhodanese-like domain-containing protein [Actinospica durhamensis]MBR7831808.1 sulfurtransferase [Actinospica durhamensis]